MGGPARDHVPFTTCRHPGYATAPGQVALDGDGEHRIYTKHLLDAMRVPGLPIEQAFKRVRIGVRQETGG